jgi:predicted MFS family arabinose efflux permease
MNMRAAGLALFVSALQGSLAAGSAVGAVIYDAQGPGGALVLAAAVSAAGSLALLGRKPRKQGRKH